MKPVWRSAHPFLLAGYPAAALAAENRTEGLQLVDVLFPLLASLILARLAWILSARVMETRPRQAMLASVIVLFVLWFGVFFWEPLFRHYWDRKVAVSGLVLLFWTVGFAGLGVLIVRSKQSFRATSRFLDLMSVFLFLLLVAESSTGSAESRPLPIPEATSHDSTGATPDIYLLVLDGFAGAGPLRSNYGYDLSPFQESLRRRGFFVPQRSRTNYVHTHLSLASMLNWVHLEQVASQVGSESSNRSVTHAMIERNRAARFLMSRGYEYVFFPSAYVATWGSDLADRTVPGPREPSLRFFAAWLSQTVIGPLVMLGCEIRECDATRMPYVPETAEEMERKFVLLESEARREGPKFVFAHILLPHEPFVFHSDCTHRPPVWIGSGLESSARIVREAYPAQIACLEQLLLRLIDRILETSSSPPPIIILQSDHGHGRMVLDPVTNTVIPLEELPRSRVLERASVFAAYHLPGVGTDAIADSMSPINVFPQVFNRYFGTRIPLEEDATFWSHPHRPFDLTRVRLEVP